MASFPLARPSAAAEFGDLLQSAEQLAAEMDQSELVAGAGAGGRGPNVTMATIGDLPRVERNLSQLVEAGQQLLNRTSKDSAGKEVNAAVLMGQQGLDLARMGHKLKSMAVQAPQAKQEPAWDVDVAGFLRKERELALLATIEETRAEARANAERLHWEATASSWEASKAKLMMDMAAHVGGDNNVASSILAVQPEVSLIHSATMGSAMDADEATYASIVAKMGRDVMLLAEPWSKESQREAHAIWRLTKATLAGAKRDQSQRGEDGSQWRASVSQSLVAAATQHLEETFKEHLAAIVRSDLMGAAMGGLPGTATLVRSYVRVGQSGVQPHEEPVWAYVYLCLRCGDVQAASAVAEDAGLADVASALAEVARNGRPSASAEQHLRAEYKRNVRASADAYERAVYCMISAADFDDEHSDVVTSIDDYLWIRLKQVSEMREKYNSDLFFLADPRAIFSRAILFSLFFVDFVPVADHSGRGLRRKALRRLK